MATKTQIPSWTEGERNIADNILEEAKNYSGNFLERYGAAAKAYGYDSYGDLPTGTKAFISSLGGKRGSHQAKPKKQIVSSQKKVTSKVPTTEEWCKEVAGSKTLQHGLHPKDEAGLIKFFKET